MFLFIILFSSFFKSGEKGELLCRLPLGISVLFCLSPRGLFVWLLLSGSHPFGASPVFTGKPHGFPYDLFRLGSPLFCHPAT